MKFNSKAKILIGISVVVLLIVASTVFLSSTSTNTVPVPDESSGEAKGSSVVHNDVLTGSETNEDVRSVLGTNSEHGDTDKIVREDQEERLPN